MRDAALFNIVTFIGSYDSRRGCGEAGLGAVARPVPVRGWGLGGGAHGRVVCTHKVSGPFFYSTA